ncbi:hypothetical protein, partial [Bifidobacterium animalis]|uniref:hypothetical protein n=1 Tax=Bifidobacterium animalis TaxID=28025 RepID=UPI001EE40FD5
PKTQTHPQPHTTKPLENTHHHRRVENQPKHPQTNQTTNTQPTKNASTGTNIPSNSFAATQKTTTDATSIPSA